jgi:hypothetical protein
VLRREALLYVKLNCIYVNFNENLVLTLGQSGLELGRYASVLSPDETFGVYVNSYLAHSRLLPRPDPSADDHRWLNHRASYVEHHWIVAHMFLRSGNILTAAGLARRASETMQAVGAEMREMALGLAEQLGVRSAVESADNEAAIRLVQPHPLHVFIPRVPYDAEFRWFHPRSRAPTVPLAEKSEERVAFESEVLEAFSACVRDGVQLSATGTRMCFEDMSEEERAATGTVLIKDILQDLEDEQLERAALKSLMAGRALMWTAAKLQRASDLFLSH